MRPNRSSPALALHGPWSAAVVCVGLIVLALWLLVRIAWLLLPRDDAALDVAAPASVAVTRVNATSATSVARWHLFGQMASVPRVGPAASIASLGLILHGTVAEGDPKAGVAMIATAGAGERAFKVGEDVAPGVQLVGVYHDRVLLQADGREEALALPRDRTIASATAVQLTPAGTNGRVTVSTSAPLSPAAATANAHAAHVTTSAPADWANQVARLKQNPQELMQRLQPLPVFEGTRINGVRLGAGADAALVGQIGLQPGDLVTAINGMPIDSIERGEQIARQLGNAESVRVTVIRNGQPNDITIGLR